MTSDGPPRTSRWKRRIRRVLGAAALAPVLALLAVNLALATPWVRGWLGQRISVRSGLEAEVGRASCTPWGGVFIGDLSLRQPAALRAGIDRPLLVVRGIHAVPRWSRLARGKLELAEVRIEGPRAVVAVEMLASLLSSAPAAVPAAPPALAVVPVPSPAAGGSAATAAPPAAGGPGTESPAPPAVAAPVAGDPRETAWVTVTDAHLQLRSAGSPLVLAEIAGFNARIPLAGRPASSAATLERLDAFGVTLARGLSLPLAWRSPELRAGPQELTVAGVQVKLAGAFGRLPGSPFAVELLVPPQPLDATAFWVDLQPVAARIEARVQGGGLLRQPSSWQGLAVAAADRPAISWGGAARRFDQARVTVGLQSGVLVCPDARLVGEPLALLGNGQLRGGGQGSAVLRVVLPPAVAADLSKRFLAPGTTAGPRFKPLETPDRMFIDLRWVSYQGGQGVELGEGGPVVAAGELARLVTASAPR